MLAKAIKLFTSMRLTVVCLGLGVLLVFIGTLAQVDEGLYQAQSRYFRSWLITRPLNLPIIFPGGYLLGLVLMVNLVAAHAKRFQLTRKKTGLFMIHIGIVLLLLGQLLTDMLSRESAMRLTEGQSKNYSESFQANELALVDSSDPQNDTVISIPDALLAEKKEVRVPQTSFTLRVKNYWPNAMLSTNAGPIAVKADATKGIGSEGVYVFPMPETAKSEERSMPGAVVEVVGPEGSLGSWLVSCELGAKQEFTYHNRSYQLAMRFKRYYQPFYLHLAKFTHEKYRGTEIPKNFASCK